MTKLIIAIVMTLTATFANAQLKDSGKTVTKEYDYQNFDKLSFEGFNDDIQVEIGATFKVEITMKESNENKIQFSYNEKDLKLSLRLKAKTGKELYNKREQFQIKITMPKAVEITNSGNSNMIVKNISGTFFRLINTGNGDTTIRGLIDVLDIDKTGNGDVNAVGLIAKKANVKSTGNGNLTLNITEDVTAKLIGNGDIINKGKAKFDAKSIKVGNGDLIVTE